MVFFVLVASMVMAGDGYDFGFVSGGEMCRYVYEAKNEGIPVVTASQLAGSPGCKLVVKTDDVVVIHCIPKNKPSLIFMYFSSMEKCLSMTGLSK